MRKLMTSAVLVLCGATMFVLSMAASHRGEMFVSCCWCLSGLLFCSSAGAVARTRKE